MMRPEATVDLAALLEVKREYHARLEQDPSDSVARMGLSWALLCEALCRFTPDIGAIQAVVVDRSIAQQSAHEPIASAAELIRASVHHAATTKRLALDPDVKADAERLEEMVRMVGCGAIVDEAESTARAQMSALVRDVLRGMKPGDD